MHDDRYQLKGTPFNVSKIRFLFILIHLLTPESFIHVVILHHRKSQEERPKSKVLFNATICEKTDLRPTRDRKQIWEILT